MAMNLNKLWEILLKDRTTWRLQSVGSHRDRHKLATKMGAKESDNLEVPMDTENKLSKQILLFISKDPEIEIGNLSRPATFRK